MTKFVRSMVAKSLPKSQMILALLMIQIQTTFSLSLMVALVTYLFLAFTLYYFEPVLKSSKNTYISECYESILKGSVSRLFCYPLVAVFYFYMIATLIQTIIFFTFCFALYAIDRILYNGFYLNGRFTF